VIPMDVAARAGRLRTTLDGAGCDALLVTSLTNVRWLTGFTGSAARVVVLPDELVLVTDGRYGDQAEVELAAAGVEAGVVVGRTQAAQRDALVELVGSVGRIGLEADHVSWAAQRAYATDFGRAELVPTGGLVESLRVVKDDGEVARIEAAADIASAALDRVLPMLSAPTARASTPSSPAAPTPGSLTTTRGTGASSRATCWSSTSARSSTATTPT
jgi:Xaa-Pro aminopeptidase